MVQPLGKKVLVWTVLLEILIVDASFYIDRIVQDTELKLVLSNPRFGDGLQYDDLSPNYAIDGQRWHDWYKNFAHSLSWIQPSFLVDLPKNDIRVGKVLIFPRQNNDAEDIHYKRYKHMGVKIDGKICELNWLNPSGLDVTTIEELKESGIEFDCKGVVGSKIVVENGNDYIQIAEIEAYEFRPNLVLTNPRFEDDKYYDKSGYYLYPKYAIDGKWLGNGETNGYVSSKYKNKRFFVDLPNPQVKVQKVIIYPRQDDHFERYEDTEVKIDEKSCITNQKLDKESVEASKRIGLIFYCDGLSGSRIVVKNKNDQYLNFAEIVAYDSTVRENIIIHPNYHLKFSIEMNNLGNLNKFRSILSFELDTHNNNQLMTVNDPANYPRLALPDNFDSDYLQDLEGRAIQINHFFQYHDDQIENKENLMIQDYKFYPETETETDKWVKLELIKHNSNMLAWIDGKEYVLYRYNITHPLEFRNDTLPLLKKDTLGNLKVFYKHDYNNENYLKDFEIRELSYGPFPNKQMRAIANSQMRANFNLTEITSTSIQLETFSNIPQLKAKLMKENECPLNQQVRKRRSTSLETSNKSQQIATTAAAPM